MRKTKVVTVTREGRDQGKAFLITEMPAMQAEKWAAKALLALSRSGVEVDDETMQAGAAAVLAAGLGAFRKLDFNDAEPLLDEMMSCVRFVPDPARRDEMTAVPVSRDIMPDGPAGDGDIAEVATLLFLRGEVIEIHTGFSVTAVLSSMGAAVQNGSLRSTPTSRQSSARSSGAGSRPSTKRKRSTA